MPSATRPFHLPEHLGNTPRQMLLGRRWLAISASLLCVATLLCAVYLVARMAGAGPARWMAGDAAISTVEIALFLLVAGVGWHFTCLWQEEHEHIVQLALLNELSLLLADTRRLDDVLARLVEVVPPALHVQGCAIVVDDPVSGRRIWASLGADTTALVDDALLSREAVAAAHRHNGQGIMRLAVQEGVYGAIYVLPLEIDERAVGMLSVARVTPQPFGARDQRVFESLAQHAAQALRNARLMRLEAEAATQSRELERFKSEMLASVSHEFRLPISSISLSAETLLSQFAGMPEEWIEARLVRNIQRSAHRLSGFVQDLMDLTRLEAHQLELRMVRCDVVALAEAAAHHIAPQCEMKGQHLAFTTLLDTCLVRGDAQRLEQVLSNLLTNAHQYTPEGGAITLSLAPAALLHTEGPCGPDFVAASVAIGVRDSGPGIPPEERDHIFERFQRGEAGRKRSSGAGLGLHIARSVVELHGGCLWVESNTPGGSTFWCVLPMLGDEVAGDAKDPVADAAPRALETRPVHEVADC